jgi:hypothetical protein
MSDPNNLKDTSVGTYHDWQTEDKSNSSKFSRFLWWCAGADKFFMERSPQADRIKYQGIGGIVLCTGILALVSGMFAFYTIFGPKTNAVNSSDSIDWATALPSGLFGIVWGLIIFNLDRFIVSSTGKGDGTDSISGKELLQGLPRILVAIILGFAVSAPLEVRILKSEIDAELQKKQNEYLHELNHGTDSLFNQQRKVLEAKKVETENQIKTFEDYKEKRRIEIKDQLRNLELEAEGKTGTGMPGRGPAYRDKKENLERMDAELNKLVESKQPEMNGLKNRLEQTVKDIDELEVKRKSTYLENQKASFGLDGLLERIKISHEIGGWVPWIILLVFLAIETGPIFFKMMMTKGVYDYLVENSKHRFLASNGVLHTEEIFHGKDGAVYKETYIYLEAEMDEAAKKEVIEKQKALNQKIIGEWHKDTDSQVNADPQSFYNTNPNSNSSNI